MITCSPRPDCMFKAVALSLLHNDSPQLHSSIGQTDLFSLAEGHNADHVELKTLLGTLSIHLSKSFEWVLGYRGRRLQLMALLNLRHRSNDRFNGIFAAFKESILFGPDSCFFGRGPAGKIFRQRSRDVGHEIHRMLGLIRFYESTSGILIARPKLFHESGDIILRKFQSRYPGKVLAFALQDEVLVCRQGRVCRMSPENFPDATASAGDSFSELWQTYYHSQYIQSRKNIRLASRFIPKKYWDWLEEGKILDKESRK